MSGFRALTVRVPNLFTGASTTLPATPSQTAPGAKPD
jgi:hypothetical protein